MNIEDLLSRQIGGLVIENTRLAALLAQSKENEKKLQLELVAAKDQAAVTQPRLPIDEPANANAVAETPKANGAAA